MLGLGQSAQAYASDDALNMNQAKDKTYSVPGCGRASDLKYPHRDGHSSSHEQRSGILPTECPGPTLNTGAGSIGIPGCGKVTNRVVSDYNKNARSTLANFDSSKMTEARMNSKNVPIGCQDTSDPHFNGPIDQHVPGAGSPQSQPHHIDAWNSVSSRRADNNNQDMMDPQTASSDRYNEKMMREENSGVSASSYTTKVQGYPASIPSFNQETEEKETYGVGDRHNVPRNQIMDETNPSANVLNATDHSISHPENKVLHK
ncbi:CCQ_1a_G0044520.mRNA.1.CDS.1 [Saccharomyces cerevisiae]|nr:CCQ_1a_G0044520.mRNA.1.CDS.1 [Saccharomyces cerevisiae]CAI7425513.1 CCQ_1a_G0044520.mRNA.1.CDS.1 [Saccharomyces cerevisiae]